jgi:hypothetical protein
MAGYSGTPLPQKLGIKPGHRLLLRHPPRGFDAILSPLPADVLVLNAARGRDPFDVIVLFAESAKDFESQFPGLAERLDPAGGLWVAWPKKSSGVTTDLTENTIRDFGLLAGLVDNKVCAIDETWSGLRFVYRLVNRPRPA